MKIKINYLSILSLVVGLTIALQLSGCKDKGEKDGKIDKTALLIGTWTLSETTDPANAPARLQYSFEEDGTFVSTVTVKKGKLKSIINGTWRFIDADQTQVELNHDTINLYTMEILEERALRLNDGQVTLTFSKD